MSREIIKCEDGSFSIRSEEFQQTYHSETGALAESEYVYIRSGLEFYLSQTEGEDASKEALPRKIKILEAGFGTGMDVLLSALEAWKRNLEIDYHVIELYPLVKEEWTQLDYGSLLEERFPGTHADEIHRIFQRMHSCEWNRAERICEGLTLTKIPGDISDKEIYLRQELQNIDVVFFDAFSPDCQPELWTGEIFKAIYRQLRKGGVLTTYSSKGLVKENLRQAGFFVKRLKGIGHKRHIVRAIKY